MKSELRNFIGILPESDSTFKHRARFHQGWWRAFVLAEGQGPHPLDSNKRVCSMIDGGEDTKKNFLSQGILDAVLQTITERKDSGSGLLEQKRLFNNLLSSQPLCFNFFGELKSNKVLALEVLRQFWPDLTGVSNVMFEYAPEVCFTDDNSAFDVAFEVSVGDCKGIVGMECKYTDSFSKQEYHREAYYNIYERAGGDVFNGGYKDYTTSKFNQLFRNQLIAEAMVQNGQCDFTYSGLFCHHQDDTALQTGTEFQSMLKNGKTRFQVITYRDFIEALQCLPISWQLRELSMKLWARYCGTFLSDHLF